MISANRVKFILARAGHKGANNRGHGGFKITPHGSNAVWISWRQPDTMTDSEAVITRADMLTQYTAVLTAAGYSVEATDYSLTVTQG